MLKLLSNNFDRLFGGSVTLLALLILTSFIVFSCVPKRIVPRPALEGGTPKDAATMDAFLYFDRSKLDHRTDNQG
jgi:hypothetical protein